MIKEPLSTSLCEKTGLNITTSPDWTIRSEKGTIEISIIDNSILKFALSGHIDLVANKATEAVVTHIIDNVLPGHSNNIQIVDMSELTGYSVAAKLNYINSLKKRKQSLGHIYYNVSTMSKLSIRIGRKINRVKSGIHIVNTYEEAVSIARKILASMLPATEIQLNTTQIPFSFSKTIPELKPSGNKENHISSPIFQHYENELLHFLENINWETHGIDDNLKNVPRSHPFRLVFEAIGLIKLDLDSLANEQAKANKALIQSEKLYRLLAENTEDVIWISDLDINPVYLSPSMERLSGYPVDYLMTRPFLATISPESSKQAIRLLKKELEKERSGKYDPSRSALIELENIHKNGSKYWTEVKVSFLRNEKGKATRIIGVTRNITERKTAEKEAKKSSQALKHTQAQLIQAEKMAALGGLVAGVSHEISTPLGVSVTASSFLHQKATEFQTIVNKGSATKKEIDKFTSIAIESTSLISNNLQRSAELINSFKQVAVDQSTEAKRKFNLKDYLEEILQNLNPGIKRTNHTIILNCPEDIVINSFPGAFSQIFTNLIMNSLIHGFESISDGIITIDNKRDDKYLEIKYRDNGKGMSKKVLSQLYNPFYTTKRGSGGTGLGMHITYNIITRKLNGLINCISTPGKGTTFLIKLPH